MLPITFGLRPEIVDMSGSRWLIDKLWKLDFPVSYYAIKSYKQSVTSNYDSLSAIATRKQTSSSGLRIKLITIFQY